MTPRNKKWPANNLGELITFLDRFYPDGIPLCGVADRLNTTEQAVSNMFRRDDMKLSKAEEIASAYGYTLRLFFKERTYIDGYVPRKPRWEYPDAGNLAGLVKYIQDSEYSIAFVAEKSRMSPLSIRKAFLRGDMMISRIIGIVDNLGIFVSWQFEKNHNND